MKKIKMIKLKKIKDSLLPIIAFALILALCVSATFFIKSFYDTIPSDVTYRERSHLYWETVECTVTDADYHYWYASGCHYKMEISVHNNEYNLDKSFDLDGQDAIKFQNVRNGDVVYCTLYSEVYDSTGEVINRYIHTIDSVK